MRVVNIIKNIFHRLEYRLDDYSIRKKFYYLYILCILLPLVITDSMIVSIFIHSEKILRYREMENAANAVKFSVSSTVEQADNLYVLAEIKDACLNKESANAWEQDSFEIFIDENNGKTANYEKDDCQYRINYENERSFNGENANDSNIQSAAVKTADGYVIEAKLTFQTVKGAKNKQIGVDFQINDADASGTRVATINWYDASGMGYAQPAVFGTAKLVKTVNGDK